MRTKGRLARLGAALVAVPAGLALAYVLVVYVGGALLNAVVWGLVLLPRAFMWLVLALQEGADGWVIAGRVASSVAGVLSTTEVAFSVIALELIGAAALYGLQRLLRDETGKGAEGAENAEGDATQRSLRRRHRGSHRW